MMFRIGNGDCPKLPFRWGLYSVIKNWKADMRAARDPSHHPPAPRIHRCHAVIALLILGVFLLMLLPANADVVRPGCEPTYESGGLSIARSCWLRWWEANKDEYLPAPPKRPAAPPAVLEKVEAALVVATRSPLPGTRAAAALALGRMGAGDAALRRLAEMIGDGDQRVRTSVWIALALFNSPKARALLLQKQTLGEADTIAWVTALGLLDKPDDQIVNALKYFVGQTKSNLVQIMALRSISNLNPPSARDIMLIVLNNTDSGALASEAILGLGVVHDPRDLPLLLDLLGHVGLTSKLGVERALNAGRSSPEGQSRYDAFVLESRTCAAMALSHYPDLDAAAAKVGIPSYTVRVTMDRYVFFNDNFLDEYYKDLLAINLGRLGDPDALPGLFQVFDGLRHTPAISGEITPASYIHGFEPGQHLGLPPNMGSTPIPQQAPVNEPQISNQSYRMFGAIALGLHLRRAGDQQQSAADAKASGGRADPYVFQRGQTIDLVSRRLADRLADPGEWTELRAACALALGLSGRRENADLILRSAKSIGQASDFVPGYAVLALGMLHDSQAISGASRLLGPPAATLDVPRILHNDASATPGMDLLLTLMNDHRRHTIVVPGARSPMEGILSRRAAALGLALVPDPEALPPLRSAWGYEYSISQQAASALAAHGAFDDTDDIITVLQDSKTLVAPVLAAWTLGEMFDQNDRLKRLARDTDFLVDDDIRLNEQWNYSAVACSWDQWNADLISNHLLWPVFSIADEFLFRAGIGATSSR